MAHILAANGESRRFYNWLLKIDIFLLLIASLIDYAGQ